LRTGLLRRITERVRGPNKAVAACAALFIGLSWIIGLPWAIYTSWWREHDYGLSKQPLAGWLGESALSAVIGMVLATLLAIAVYALMRRTPRRWWAWSGGVAALAIVILVVLAPVLIEPLFNTYDPAPAGPTRDAVVALARRAEVPADKILIYDGSRQSERYTANVSGLLGTARIAMSDTMFRQGADLAEVRGVVGHEMGHYRHGHVFLSALVLSLLAVLMLFVADRVFPATARLVHVDDVAGIADPAGLPVLMMILSVVGFLAMPVTNSLTRFQESDADRFSLATAHEPEGLARALVKTIEYRASSPGPVEEAIFYDHPSVERRVHRAMVWKAQHPDLLGR
ncbi:MAG: M48 family peptidase, partial [Oxalobacteraceae bacterium]